METGKRPNGREKMIFIDENTSRADLEIAAIFECQFEDLDAIASASDAELLQMILDWIEAGDETGFGG
jgi:hypothetical protein